MKKTKCTQSVLIIVMYLILVTFISGCSIDFDDTVQIEGINQLRSKSLHDFDWTNLYEENGRKQYKSTEWETLTGIDVSTHQGSIDWKQVKENNIDFAMIRAGYRGYGNGKIVEDDMFKTNISSAANAGIDAGVYFFSQAISEREAREEAKLVIDLIKDYDIKYPIVFDMEFVTENDRIRDVPFKQKTQIAIAFCEEIVKSGYTPMIYGSTSWLQNTVFIDKLLKYDLWIADYSDYPDFPYDFKMWQYTNTGVVSGIDGNVDINLYFIKK